MALDNNKDKDKDMMSSLLSQSSGEFFLDEDFVLSAEGRPLRLLAEYLGPEKCFKQQHLHHTVVFMGSARISSPEQIAELEKTAKTDKEKKDLQRKKKMLPYYEEARQLAHKLTEWSQESFDKENQVYVCTGGGPGIMEAGNRGAKEAGGKSVALNILLPHEQGANKYVTDELSILFRYFFMRKLWFLYYAKGMIFFPGGFGTLDELSETLTLVQTAKMKKKVPIILYGKEFWEKTLNFDNLVEGDLISEDDVGLFRYADTVEEAFSILTEGIQESVSTYVKTLLHKF